MNPDDFYSIDHTGFGPAGTGGAPNMQEFMRNRQNQYMTSRAAQAAAFIDPVANAAAQKITKALLGNATSGAALRRAVYNTSQGQAAMDAAMMGRVTGLLGQGDPVSAAANIAQGVAGGGFRMAMSGRNSYGTGYVSGAGNIGEHVTIATMKSLMGDLFSGGNKSRTSGFNTEEVSALFKTFAQRGNIGEIATVHQNASVATRLRLATENAIDPSLKDKLGAIKLGKNDGENLSILEKIIGSTTDEKFKSEVRAITTTTGAVEINKGEGRRIQSFVEDLTQGLASLHDVYQELSAPELQTKLESISGLRMNNRENVARATQLTNQMRGAAVISGMDPRAFMDWNQGMQASLRGDVARVMGADGRHGTAVQAATAQLNAGMMVDSAISAKFATRNETLGKSLGINMTTAQNAMEIYEDKRQGRVEFMDRFKATTMTMGGLGRLSGDRKARAQSLLAKFEQTTDAEQRENIENQLQGVWSDEFGGIGFGAAYSSNMGKRAMTDAMNDPAAQKRLELAAALGRRDALNIEPVIGKLKDMGVADAKLTGNQILKDVGVGSMLEMLKLSKNKNLTGSARAEAQMNQLRKSGLSAADSQTFFSKFFDKNGQARNAAGLGDALRTMAEIDTEPGLATGDRAGKFGEMLNMMGAESRREKLSSGGALSVNSIATALATEGMRGGLTDPESIALALQALDGSKLKVPDIMGKDGKRTSVAGTFKTGIDFSKGLTKGGMASLVQVLGKDINLHEKLVDPKTGKKFGSMDELIKATQGEGGKETLYNALHLMKTDKDYLGLNLSGGVGSMTAISDTTKNTMKNSGWLDRTLRRIGGAEMVTRAMGVDPNKNTTSLLDSVRAGGTANLAEFEISGSDESNKGTTAKFGRGLGKFKNLADLIGRADQDEMLSISELNTGGQLRDAMAGQLRIVKGAMRRGRTHANFEGVDGKGVSTELGPLHDQLTAAIQKLEEVGVNNGDVKNFGSVNITNCTITNFKKEPVAD